MNSIFCSLLAISLTLLPFLEIPVNGVEYLENGIAKLSGGDIDVQTCVDNFDIHKDNIIRTQDSRAMGAKYLSEIELDSRLECLRLCCETEHCDVFVYEDKGPGSCYLFECGPPKDFKCKFTHHVNYTSGILGVNRHANSDLEMEIQHEKDLNKLRNPNYNNQEGRQHKNNATVVHNVLSVKPTADVVSNKGTVNSVLDKGTSKCSRNQFECRTSKDCIAIYNACDGVPQCPDGSDEAKELGCPDTSLGSGTTGIPLMASQNGPQTPSKMDIVMGSQNINRLNNHATLEDEKHQNLVNTAQDDYSSKQIVSHNSIGREGVVQQDYNLNRDRDVGQQQMLQYPSSGYLQQQQQQQQSLLYSSQQQQQQQQEVPLSVALPRLPQTNWFPHTNPNNVPSGLSALPEQSSHIFNHKVNGLQVADTDPQTLRAVQQQYSLNDLNQRERGYQQQALPGGYYSDIYNNKSPESIPQINPNWQRNPGTGLYNQQQNSDSYRQSDLSMTQDVTNNWQSNEPSVASSPKHEQDAMAHELKHSKEHFEADSTPKSVAKEEREHDHTKYAVVVDELAETIENIEDGVAQTPNGAVLSLILGLLITCMLAILIGCRLRVVRRRIRRGGGKSYAHDADYLVNGMYL